MRTVDNTLRRFTVIFDGGKSNLKGTYGSYQIKNGDQLISREVQESFNCNTSNEAEYTALDRGIKALLEILRASNIPTEEVNVTVLGDSELVINQLRGLYQIKSDNLFPLFRSIVSSEQCFCNIDYRWMSGKKMKHIMGH